MGDLKVFAGNSNRALAEQICASLGVPLGDASLTKFSDGETWVEVGENVRGRDVFVVQSTSSPANDNLTRLLGQPIPSEVLVVPMLMNGGAKGYLLGDIPCRSIPGQVQKEVAFAARAAGDALAAVLRGRF